MNAENKQLINPIGFDKVYMDDKFIDVETIYHDIATFYNNPYEIENLKQLSIRMESIKYIFKNRAKWLIRNTLNNVLNKYGNGHGHLWFYKTKDDILDSIIQDFAGILDISTYLKGYFNDKVCIQDTAMAISTVFYNYFDLTFDYGKYKDNHDQGIEDYNTIHNISKDIVFEMSLTLFNLNQEANIYSNNINLLPDNVNLLDN